MTTRTTSETITFLHPFRLGGADDIQPAGRYLVETDEELIQNLSFPAYRRVSTFIHLAGRPNSNELARVVELAPAELAAVRARDARAQEIGPTVPHPLEMLVGVERDRDEMDVVDRWGVAFAGLLTSRADDIPAPASYTADPN
jgi:hypothetical protein